MSVQGQFTNSACLNLFLKQGILLMVDSFNDFEITNTVRDHLDGLSSSVENCQFPMRANWFPTLEIPHQLEID